MHSSRREFLQQGLLAGSTILLPEINVKEKEFENNVIEIPLAKTISKVLDLSPARWIWLPAERTLPNTILLFRKSCRLSQKPLKATGWITGESRYKLYANGNRIQFGPAPSDPRWSEADPFDITHALTSGDNTIGVEVLFYGLGDGTWPIGKPGFIFKMEIEYEDGRKEAILSDETWNIKVADSWRPGQYKRWYLRAFQEEFDARLYPYGWYMNKDNSAGWLPAALLKGAADKPALSTNSSDYLNDAAGNVKECELRPRSIKLLREMKVPVKKITEQYHVKWKMDPQTYFQFVLPKAYCYDIIKDDFVQQLNNNRFQVNMQADRASVLTFEMEEQVVGFPYFTIEAPEGTIIEMLVHEAHTPGTDSLMNSHFNSWTRFICKEGINIFETFDFESLRWMQLHIRNCSGTIIVSDAGVRRRMYDWTNQPLIKVDDKKIQALINASVNTIYNCCQETCVDGMARERQQYSGDAGHLVHAILYGMGQPEMVARYLTTFSQGITAEGYFLDCWPAFDRLARLPERQMGMTSWGPLLDHGVGFNFDCFYYYRYTNDTVVLGEVFPRLVKFYKYLLSLLKSEYLLPVENIGTPSVWIDHDAYLQQRHKQCAFNLYAAAMMQYAFAPLCRAFNAGDLAKEAIQNGQRILQATIKKFWSYQHNAFINNLPWLSEEKAPRMCDRSLATAVLFDQMPAGSKSMTQILISQPGNMGISYPANACWRYWALAKQGYHETVMKEFADKWYNIPSVSLNNTLAETWKVTTDSNNQWSHCPVVPFYFMYMNIAGVTPLQPGYEEILIEPALGGLKTVRLNYYTIKGMIEFDLYQQNNSLSGSIKIPAGIKATLQYNTKKVKLSTGINNL
ncbi:MAG: alpha-L-rhamnosidase N-terminal domain-containing protein [Chitinophagaceae bacterium]